MIQEMHARPNDTPAIYLLRLQEKLNEVIAAINRLEDRQTSDAMAAALSRAPDGRI